MITFQLEHRFTKKQIFEMYANQINLGQRGSFSINGFGEAAQAYFGKDVRQLDLAECALLAGVIQSPNRLNPFRHPERAMERRNLVLDSMVETGAITKEQAEAAKARAAASGAGQRGRQRSALFCRPGAGPADAEAGRSRFQRRGVAHLHFARSGPAAMATEAVNATVPMMDAQVDRLHARAKKLGKPYDTLSAGGADRAESAYRARCWRWWAGAATATSQLNHAVAHRPTGSIFKPFVYAAAFPRRWRAPCCRDRPSCFRR